MAIKNKTNEELQAQVEGFLDYAKLSGDIRNRIAKKIMRNLSENGCNIAIKDGIRKDLSGILSDDRFDELYYKYETFLKAIGGQKNLEKFFEKFSSVEKFDRKNRNNLEILINFGLTGERLLKLWSYSIYDNYSSDVVTNIMGKLEGFGMHIMKMDDSKFNIIKNAFRHWVSVEKNLNTLKDFGINIFDELENLGNILYSNNAILNLLLKRYPEVSIKELNAVNRDFSTNKYNSLYPILTGSEHRLKLIFIKYPKISINQLIGINKIIDSYWKEKENMINKMIDIIFGRYPNISPDQLALLENIIVGGSKKKLDMIFEKYPNISPDQLALLDDVLHNSDEDNNIKDLKLIFKRYPNISLNELNQFKSSSSLYGNLKIIFKRYPNISLKDLIELRDLLSISDDINLKRLFDVFDGITIEELKNNQKIGTIELPKKIKFKESNRNGYLPLLNDIASTGYDNDKKIEMVEKILGLTFDEAENYLEVFKMFDDSISMDVKRIKNELIVEILRSEDPMNVAKEINNIFEKNNLPLTGKIFKVFEILYPKKEFINMLNPASGKGALGSPILNEYVKNNKDVYKLIYRDLMDIAIKSGDRSLRDFLKIFVGSKDLLEKFEKIINDKSFNPNDKLCLQGKFDEKDKVKDEKSQAKLLYLFRKIAVLVNSYLGKKINEGDENERDEKKGDKIESKKLGESTVTDNKLIEFYNEIKRNFNLRDGMSMYDRLQAFLYINGLKYHSAEEVLEEMNKSKKQAHEKGLKLYNASNGGKIKFPKETFLKGVDERAFSKIINRGITSREYLGGGESGHDAGSDMTPFDIDGWYTKSFFDGGYGNVKLVIDTKKDCIFDSTKDGTEGYSYDKYELFKTGCAGKNHYGIRTGIPMTEVDYIIYTGKPESKEFQDICYEIARNGYYIPITDRSGNIKYTPEMYHKIRLGFNFMEYYDGFDTECVNGKWISKESDNEVHKKYSGENDKITNDNLNSLIAANSPSNTDFVKFAKENSELAKSTIKYIMEILEDCGIEFNSEFDTSITGAELHDSGSTGRGTDIPTKDVDLDFTLILDANDYEKVDEIRKIIHEKIGTEESDDHYVQEGGNQIKSKKNNIGKSEARPNGVPLDLLILKKSQVIDYSSSDAMKEKLDFIASNPETGAEDLDFVRTNVIIMKKLLKAKGCYKKPEGGIAGIGVENWIIQNHGNFIEALESFEQVAYGGKYEKRKRPISLNKFKKLYPIYDAGENYKDGGNDNFVYKIDKDKESKDTHCYESILDIIKALRTEGIEGIEKLIREYEEKKKKYINK